METIKIDPIIEKACNIANKQSDKAAEIIKKGTALLGLVLILMSCGVQAELLTDCDRDDRLITGITKNGKRYTALDGCGNWAEPIRCDVIDSSKIGTYLICRDEYDR